MKNGCLRVGLRTTIIKASPGEFERIQWPGIAHLYPNHESGGREGHFVVVLEVDDRAVRYIEPNYAAVVVTVPRGDFFRAWSGHLLMPVDSVRQAGDWVLRGECGVLALMSVAACYVLWRGWPPGVQVLRSTMCFALCAIGAGCADEVSGPEASNPEVGTDSGALGLTLWKSEADVGLLPADGEAVAEFALTNSGSSMAEVRMGTPSCQCTTVEIDHPRLAPGEDACIRLGMKADGTPGPSTAFVELAVEDQKWCQTVRISGVEPGLQLLGGHYGLKVADRAGVVVRGTAYVHASTDTVSAAARVLSDDVADLVVVEPPETLNHAVHAGFASCDLVVRIVPTGESVLRLTTARSVMLQVEAGADGQRYVDEVVLELLPAESGTESGM